MWYRGTPGQEIIISEPASDGQFRTRTITFDEHGYYWSDSRTDHLVLTGYAAGDTRGEMAGGHGTLCLGDRDPTKEDRFSHASMHENCDCLDPDNCVEHACCGLHYIKRLNRVARIAAVEVLQGNFNPPVSGGGFGSVFSREAARIFHTANLVNRGRRPLGDLIDLCAPHNYVKASVARDGKLIQISHDPNLRTDAGDDGQSKRMGDSGYGGAVSNYIALTTDTAAPAVTDTTLASEITTGGLARALGTFSHTTAAASYKISKTFTASASHTAVVKAGEFDASSAGNMWFESTFSSVNLQSGDTLTTDWTKNI